MADKKDYTKLKSFVEAAMTNPLHPVYTAGMAKSMILQHYALNVHVMESIKADDWFESYPQYTDRLEAVMKLCEESGMVKEVSPVIETKEETPVKEAFPPQVAAGAPAQGGQMDVRQMIADMHGMMSKMMAQMEQDAQGDKAETPPTDAGAAPADKKPPMAMGK